MARTLLSAILAMLLLACGAPRALAGPPDPPPPSSPQSPSSRQSLAAASGRGGGARLTQRLQQWPLWRLPAPLPRPGNRDLTYPAWFAGSWQVSSRELPADAEPAEPTEPTALAPSAELLSYPVRFRPDANGRTVGDRAYNARAIGRALFGEGLQSVRNDPTNPNRQLARLPAGRLLESSVVGRLSGTDATGDFLADELSLQVLHGPTDPRISRVEILSRWRWYPGAQGGRGWIEAEQWQASYPSPAAGLTAAASSVSRRQLRLEPLPQESDPAS